MRRVLREAVYGDTATVFHRTHSASNMNGHVLNHKLEFGHNAGNMYGPGIYTVYDIESTREPEYGTDPTNPDGFIENGEFRNKHEGYGGEILKFKANISQMLILDFDVFLQTSFGKQSGATKDTFFEVQLNRFGIKLSYDDVQFLQIKIDSDQTVTDDGPVYTSNGAVAVYDMLTKYYQETEDGFNVPCTGMIFMGRQDGRVAVFWHPYILVPVSLSLDNGKTWSRVPFAKMGKPTVQNGMIEFDVNGDTQFTPMYLQHLHTALSGGLTPNFDAKKHDDRRREKQAVFPKGTHPTDEDLRMFEWAKYYNRSDIGQFRFTDDGWIYKQIDNDGRMNYADNVVRQVNGRYDNIKWRKVIANLQMNRTPEDDDFIFEMPQFDGQLTIRPPKYESDPEVSGRLLNILNRKMDSIHIVGAKLLQIQELDPLLHRGKLWINKDCLDSNLRMHLITQDQYDELLSKYKA